jgi:hypothetical protein
MTLAAALTAAMPEQEWQEQVLELAHLCGWRSWHVLDARGMERGWPDLTLARPPRLVFAELKTERGRVRPEQAATLELLRACGQEAFLWRPSDWPEVQRVLARPQTR